MEGECVYRKVRAVPGCGNEGAIGKERFGKKTVGDLGFAHEAHELGCIDHVGGNEDECLHSPFNIRKHN